MPDLTDTQAIIDVAKEAADPSPLGDDGRFFTVVTPEGGDLHIVDLEDHLDKYRDRPRRKTGTVNVHDAPAFIAYLSKHALPETEVWADLANQALVAVINAHEGIDELADAITQTIEGPAGWGDHRAQLALRKTPAWVAWAKYDKQFLTQTTFAEHVEERLPDFAAPAGADMLELAQSFKAHSKVNFESSRRLKSGETTLEYREETEATAGKKGTIAIPDVFTLGIAPFDGTQGYKVNARFRYRITDGTLSLGYVLERPEDILRAAFDDIVTAVDGGITASIWHGTPS